MLFKTPQRRRGAVTVEAAIVVPTVLFLLLAIILGGMGMFRYQQVACLAREAARYASVHGGDYQKDNSVTSPTVSQIQQQSVTPLAVGMASSNLSVQVQWLDCGQNTLTDWDSATHEVVSINSQGEYVNNAVKVTVTYKWSPGMFIGDVVLRSVSQQPMAY